MPERSDAAAERLVRLFHSLHPIRDRLRRDELRRILGPELLPSPADLEKERRSIIEAARFRGPPGHEGDVPRYEDDPSLHDPPVREPEPTDCKWCGSTAVPPGMRVCAWCIVTREQRPRMRTQVRYGSIPAKA